MPSTVEGPKFQAKSAGDFEGIINQEQQFLFVHRLLTIMLPTRFKVMQRPGHRRRSIVVAAEKIFTNDNGGIYISKTRGTFDPLGYEVAYPTLPEYRQFYNVTPENAIGAIFTSHNILSEIGVHFFFDDRPSDKHICRVALLPESYSCGPQHGGETIVGLVFGRPSAIHHEADSPIYIVGTVGFLALERRQ